MKSRVPHQWSPPQVGETAKQPTSGALSGRQLAFIGIGGIIGAGFFLGCGLPIQTAGPGVLLAFLFGGLITAQVTGALTTMAVNHPVKGSFKVYADLYLGPFPGYVQGWVYYVTSILTIASEAVAMSIFSKLWLGHTPTWLVASVFSLLIVLLNAFGIKNFGKVESMMSVIKIAALVGFIVFAALLLFTGFGSSTSHFHAVQPFSHGFAPRGITGILQSMLVVIFAFAGIGVFATAASETRDVKVIEKGAIWTVCSLVVLYMLSIGLLLFIEPWYHMGTAESPFVEALHHAGIPFLATIFNGVILVASFSVMAGAVFSANQILESLGASGEAPQFIRHRTTRGVNYGALVVTTVGIGLTITASFLLPANVYNFLISASSFFTFLNWLIILLSFASWYRKHRAEQPFTSKLSFGQPLGKWVTFAAILLLAGYALREHDQRIGFYAAVLIIALISLSYVFVHKRKKVLADERQ